MGLDFGKSSMGNPAQAGNGLRRKMRLKLWRNMILSLTGSR